MNMVAMASSSVADPPSRVGRRAHRNRERRIAEDDEDGEDGDTDGGEDAVAGGRLIA